MGGNGGGVVRSRRQVWTVSTGNGGGEVDVVLGVNGCIWICAHGSSSSSEGAERGKQVSITRIEESVTSSAYSSRNDEIKAETRREIARLAGCVRSLVEGGVRVDEEMVMRAYEESLDIDVGENGDDRDIDYLGDGKGRRVVQAALGARG